MFTITGRENFSCCHRTSSQEPQQRQELARPRRERRDEGIYPHISSFDRVWRDLEQLVTEIHEIFDDWKHKGNVNDEIKPNNNYAQ